MPCSSIKRKSLPVRYFCERRVKRGLIHLSSIFMPVTHFSTVLWRRHFRLSAVYTKAVFQTRRRPSPAQRTGSGMAPLFYGHGRKSHGPYSLAAKAWPSGHSAPLRPQPGNARNADVRFRNQEINADSGRTSRLHATIKGILTGQTPISRVEFGSRAV